MVGRTIAIDLSKKHQVTSFDVSEQNLDKLPKNIACKTADLSTYSSYPELLSDSDIVVNAVPGFMGYRTFEAIISSGKNVANISFFPEDALELDFKARQNNVTAIVDWWRSTRIK